MKFTKLILIFLALCAVSEAQAHKKYYQDRQSDSPVDTAPVSQQQEKEHPTQYGKPAKQKKDDSNGLDVDTWTDPATGLTWTRCPLGWKYHAISDTLGNCDDTESSKRFSFPDALAIVKAANTEKINGASDWRMPTVEEFDSIIAGCKPDATNDNACSSLSGHFRAETPVVAFGMDTPSWVATPSSKKPGEVFFVDNTSNFQTTSIDEDYDTSVKKYVVLVRGISSLKASIDPDILLGKVKSDAEAATAKKYADEEAALKQRAIENAESEKKRAIADAKYASDHAAAVAVYNAKLDEARKHLKRGDRVLYQDFQQSRVYTVLVLNVEQDTGMVQIQTDTGDAIYAQMDHIIPFVK